MREKMINHKGGCHCGQVRFEVTALPTIKAYQCNCSICSKSGHIGMVVPRDRFNLISGEDFLAEYRFDSGEARHLFCKHCGIYTHHRSRVSPDKYDFNVGCLEGVNPLDLGEVQVFDGINHPCDNP